MSAHDHEADENIINGVGPVVIKNLSYPETLRALKLAADEARAKYHAHKRPDGLGVNDCITFDLTDRRLRNACAAAASAYDRAVDEYLAGTYGIR